MEIYIKYLKAALIVMAVYLLGAFTQWDLNASNWGDAFRAVVALCSIWLAGMFLVISN